MEFEDKQKWSQEERQLFGSLIDVLQNNYKEYERYFPNRSYTQIKSQYHNFRNKIARARERVLA